jgi:hypothetical protein
MQYYLDNEILAIIEKAHAEMAAASARPQIRRVSAAVDLAEGEQTWKWRWYS